MSECMTLDIFAAEEKYPDEELATTKHIVQSILNETLHSVIANSEKVSDCKPIGDCNIGEDFLPQFNFIPVNTTEIAHKTPEEKEQSEEKQKEYKVVKEQALADNELRIHNGKIHLQTKGIDHSSGNNCSREREAVNAESSIGKGVSAVCVKPESPSIAKKSGEGNCKPSGETVVKAGERPFAPFTTEDLRQSVLKGWSNVDSSILNGWDGDLTNQPQEVVRIMEELSGLQVTPNVAVVDPNRPRACTLVEEDVKKIVKEIEQMNFKTNPQQHTGTDTIPTASTQENLDNVNAASGALAETKESISDSEGSTDQHPTDVKGVSLICEDTSAPPIKSQKFRDNCDLDTHGAMFTTPLTESDEAFIESSESVIQIIEPQEDSNDENEEEGKITLSLLQNNTGNYNKDDELAVEDYENDEMNCDSGESFRQEDSRIRSGMTTVGPIKNVNYDPKSLTGPEIDYGKMTRISGSREMRRSSHDSDGMECSSSKKNFMDDSGDNPTIFFEFDMIINHDIASLTKVQKVKEVLSDQPKSDEDLNEEEKLIRPPLDLKDVDGDSCSSCNVIDIGIPLLTVDEAERNNDNKDIAQHIQIILNGTDFQDGSTHSDTESQGQFAMSEAKGSQDCEPESALGKVASKSELTDDNQETERAGKSPVPEECNQMSQSFNGSKNASNSPNQKHNTISRVFQRASSRFIMKDSDSFLRNSKSLPRDTNKMANTESFKSLLDDCQASAATVLKKSRSLLRNTQNVLKAVSKTGFSHTVSGDKQTEAGSHSPVVDQLEGKQSTSLKKNEFMKLKDTIKSKVGKTLKSLENIAGGNETKATETSSGESKKLMPKSNLVCANQFPQSQSSETKNFEGEVSVTTIDTQSGNPPLPSDTIDKSQEALRTGNEVADGGTEAICPDKEIEVICSVKFQGNHRYDNTKEDQNSILDDSNDAASDQIDYVVMETVNDHFGQQVVTPNDLFDNPDAAKEDKTGEVTPRGSFRKNSSEIGKSFTLPAEASIKGEMFDELIKSDEPNLQKTLSKTRKNKNLSARIRSFWQTAFGKVKATGQKKDVS